MKNKAFLLYLPYKISKNFGAFGAEGGGVLFGPSKSDPEGGVLFGGYYFGGVYYLGAGLFEGGYKKNIRFGPNPTQ